MQNTLHIWVKKKKKKVKMKKINSFDREIYTTENRHRRVGYLINLI